MATKLYNEKGEEQFFPTKRVALMLENGWSAEKPQKKRSKKPTPVVVDDLSIAVEGEVLTDDQIREKAKASGVKNYWNKSIDSLKEDLGL